MREAEASDSHPFLIQHKMPFIGGVKAHAFYKNKETGLRKEGCQCISLSEKDSCANHWKAFLRR